MRKSQQQPHGAALTRNEHIFMRLCTFLVQTEGLRLLNHLLQVDGGRGGHDTPECSGIFGGTTCTTRFHHGSFSFCCAPAVSAAVVLNAPLCDYKYSDIWCARKPSYEALCARVGRIFVQRTSVPIPRAVRPSGQIVFYFCITSTYHDNNSRVLSFEGLLQPSSGDLASFSLGSSSRLFKAPHLHMCYNFTYIPSE